MSDAAIDKALDAIEQETTIDVQVGEDQAQIHIVQSGPLGVRVKEVSVTHKRPVDPCEEADALAQRLGRALPEALQVVEADRQLGGANLRSRPDEMEDGEFFDVRVRPDRTTVQRFRRQRGGREQQDWTMTRRDLKRLINKL